MDMEDVHASKRFRALNGSGAGGVTAAGQPASAAKVIRSQRRQLQDDETTAHGGVVKSRVGKGAMADAAALRPQWQQPSSAASRICRVSRATGGKDRHSKVFTAKGLRDRRVRLSVSTAIQFYDLQDRLGYDQPSKAVEWLIKAATAAIADLPSLDGVFPGEGNPPVTQMAEEQEDAEVDEIEQADNPQRPEQQQQQHVSLTKSACSSTSETSRGSVLSLSRPDNRIKARERARERTATAKEKEEDNSRDHESAAQFASVEEHHHQSLNLHPSSQSSFIELLTCGSQQNQSHTHSPVANLIPKQLRHSPTSPATVKADFFGQVGLFAEGEKPHQPPGFPSTQTHFNIAAAAAASASRDHPEMQQQQQQFSFMPDHLIPLAVSAAGGDYINFSVSSGIAGFNRGTLQSNFAPPQPNHHPQRLSSPVDGSNLPFFLSAAAAQAASAPWEGPFPAGFDSRLQLCYDGYRHSDLKDKGKN